jgi:transketolase
MVSNSMRGRFVEVTTDLLETDPNVALVLADITADRFLANGAAQRYPDRVINVGIREQLMVNVAAGMALEGMRPYAHTFAPFLIERSFEQVKLAFSHQGVGGVLVSWGAPYDVAAYGRTHQTAGDVALVATLPDWRIQVPGHPDEAEQMLRDAAEGEDAVYVRLSQQRNAGPQAIEDGKLVAVREGSAGAATVIAVGPKLDAVQEATADMDVTLLYATTVLPFDGVGLREHVSGSNVAIVEPYLEGTTAGAISAALADRPHRLLSIGVPPTEHRKYGSAEEHDAAHGLDGAGIQHRLQSWLARS